MSKETGDRLVAAPLAKVRRVNMPQKRHTAHTYAADEAELIPVPAKKAEVGDDVVATTGEAEAKMEKPVSKEDSVGPRLSNETSTNLSKEVTGTDSRHPTKSQAKVKVDTFMPASAKTKKVTSGHWQRLFAAALLLLTAVSLFLFMVGVEYRVVGTQAGVETTLRFSLEQSFSRVNDMQTSLFAHVLQAVSR